MQHFPIVSKAQARLRRNPRHKPLAGDVWHSHQSGTSYLVRAATGVGDDGFAMVMMFVDETEESSHATLPLRMFRQLTDTMSWKGRET